MSPDSSSYSKSSNTGQRPWWERVAERIPIVRDISASRARIVLLLIFFVSLAIATTQMLVPGWIWRHFQHTIPRTLSTGVSAFWRPIVLHQELYQQRINREIYAVSVFADDSVWIGGEQGFLAYSEDRGKTWNCFDFDTKSGGYHNAHPCANGTSDSGSVALVGVVTSPWTLPAVHAAQQPSATPATLSLPTANIDPVPRSNTANKMVGVQLDKTSKPISAAPNQQPASPITKPGLGIAQQSRTSSDQGDEQALTLSDTSHNFGAVGLNSSKSWKLIVSGTPSTKPQNLFASLGTTAAEGFRILGTNQCTVTTGTSCSFSVEFLPTKSGPYQNMVGIHSVALKSSNTANAPPSLDYMVSLIGSGSASVSAQQITTSQSAVAPIATPTSQRLSTYTPGDILNITSAVIVTANGHQLQLLVRPKSNSGPGYWVRPEQFSGTLEDGSHFSGATDKQTDPNVHLAERKNCPVLDSRSFHTMLNQLLTLMPAVLQDCGTIQSTGTIHLNAFAVARTTHGVLSGASPTGYAVGGRSGQGVIFRVDSDQSGRQVLTPLTHDAAAGTMLLPIGLKIPPPWLYIIVLLCLFAMWVITMRPAPGTPKQGIEGMAVSDRPLEPSDSDAVRLRTVADGMSRFFRNPSTRAPLVLCINGSWGSGKSSLMNLLADDLRRHYHTVIPFNAWHHQSEEQILASLLQSVRTNALRSPWTVPGAWTRLRIFLSRWPERWFVSVVFCLSTAWTLLLARDFLKTGSVDLGKVAAFIPAFVTTLVTLRTIAQGFTGFLSNPASLLATNGKGSKTELEAQTTLRERFATDFSTVTKVLGNGKLVLLIDDLDRCGPEKIREVVEAINFLVTAGDCYIVLGMAKQVVEYYLGQSFSDAIKTMPYTLLGLTEKQVKQEGRRESAFASLYLQKMIQLQFNLLPLTDDQAITLLQGGAGEYAPKTTELLKWEDRLRWVRYIIQRWFLPTTGTLLLTLGALYTASLQNSAAWVELQVAPYLAKPGPPSSTPGDARSLLPKPGMTTAVSGPVIATPSSDVSASKPVSSNSPRDVASPTLPNSIAATNSTVLPQTNFPVHDANETLASSEVQGVRNAPGAIQVLILVMVLGGGMWMLAQWWLITRPDAENARDSGEFLLALSDWAPALLALYKTPRGLKQYLNSVRFLAMLQRSQIEPSQGQKRQPFLRRFALRIVAGKDERMKGGILQVLQDQARAGFSHDPVIPDNYLVTLSALHAAPKVAIGGIDWGNPEASLGTVGALAITKISSALMATANRAGFGPHSSNEALKKLNAALTKHRDAYRKLNGQSE